MTPENEREPANGNDARAHEDAADATPEAAGADGAPRDEAGEGPAPQGEGAANGAGPAGEDGPIDGEPDGSVGEGDAEQRLAAAEALAAAHWDRLVRLQAEMENQRKRAQRDVANARKFALEGIAGDLLPVKDSLELGIQAASGADEGTLANLLQGSELTLKMLAQLLEKHGIEEVNPEGERFDPEYHQAMSMQEVEGVAPNTVTGVMQKGYTLNERLIRPALVMVSK